MGLQKFRKNILKATHNFEFLAVLVSPDSSITLDIHVSVPTMLNSTEIDGQRKSLDLTITSKQSTQIYKSQRSL